MAEPTDMTIDQIRKPAELHEAIITDEAFTAKKTERLSRL